MSLNILRFHLFFEISKSSNYFNISIFCALHIAAKDFVLKLIIEGLDPSQPCDKSFCDDDFKLPPWYDEAKYKR